MMNQKVFKKGGNILEIYLAPLVDSSKLINYISTYTN